MSKLVKTDKEYSEWLTQLSQRFRQSQIKASTYVNMELLKFYCGAGTRYRMPSC